MKNMRNPLQDFSIKERIRDYWKGIILLLFFLSIVVVFLYAAASPVVSSKEHIGVLELRDYAADRTATGTRKAVFYVKLKEERVLVIPPINTPYRKGENVIVFEDVHRFGITKYRYGGYEKDVR